MVCFDEDKPRGIPPKIIYGKDPLIPFLIAVVAVIVALASIWPLLRWLWAAIFSKLI